MSSTDATTFTEEVGGRLRALRSARCWSLQEVAEKSGWSPSVIGAWERGARTISVPQLHNVAAFYDVPIEVLLGSEPRANPSGKRRRLVLNLEALQGAPDEAAALKRYVRSIIVERGDWGGKVLTIRGSDMDAVCALVSVETYDEAFFRLDAWGVLA